jgi:hypothetical protein
VAARARNGLFVSLDCRPEGKVDTQGNHCVAVKLKAPDLKVGETMLTRREGQSGRRVGPSFVRSCGSTIQGFVEGISDLYWIWRFRVATYQPLCLPLMAFG